MLLIDYFEQTALRYPDRPFLAFVDEQAEGDVELTYAEMNVLASGQARRLQQLGIKKGDVIPLLMENSPEWIAEYLACQKIGAVSVGLHTNATPSELVGMLGGIEARHLVYGVELEPVAEEILKACDGIVGCRFSRHESGTEKVELSRLSDLAEDDFVSAIYTSGTSGSAPKAALQTHRPIVGAISQYVDELGLVAEDRIMVVTPLSHSAALNWAVSLTLITGATLVLTRRFSASRFWNQAARGGATVVWTMGTILFLLLRQPESGEEASALQKIRFFFGAGSALRKRQLVERWNRPVLDGYGMTETFGTLTSSDHSGESGPFPCVGRPVGGVDLRVVDRDGQECIPGQQGEIVARFGQGFAGYLGNQNALDTSVRDGWFHTGDLAFRDEAGAFYFVDRLKSVIRRGGENISSLEVEECLSAHPGVKEAIAIPFPDSVFGEVVLAVLVLKKPWLSLSLEDLHGFCSGRIARFKWPERVEILAEEDIPRTSSGKVQKKRLLESLRTK